MGQMTEKMRYNNTKTYEHQFAIGTTLLVGFGYAVPIGGSKAVTIELEGETSNRRGDVTGIGEDQSFRNKHVSLNVGISF